jgi:hypothetical protein
MNHGTVCKKYYRKQEWDKTVYNSNEYLLKNITEYFAGYKSRNIYYGALKHKTIMVLKGFDHTLYEIRDALNLTNHATVCHYLTKYKKCYDYDTFIEENYLKCIYEKLYPVTVYTKEGELSYKLVKKEDL